MNIAGTCTLLDKRDVDSIIDEQRLAVLGFRGSGWTLSTVWCARLCSERRIEADNSPKNLSDLRKVRPSDQHMVVLVSKRRHGICSMDFEVPETLAESSLHSDSFLTDYRTNYTDV